MSGEIQANRRLAAQGIDRFAVSTGSVLRATAEDAWARNPLPGLWRWAGREVADTAAAIFDPAGPSPQNAAATHALFGRQLTPEQANEAYGIEGRLTFSEALADSSARQLRDLKLAEMRRQDIQRRAQGGLVEGSAQFLTELIVSAADPLNVASGFIPVVGQARYATMLAKAGGAAGRAGVRMGVGAAEGAVGAALLEPLVYGVAQDEQADYTAIDSLMNIGFGTVLGGGLHATTGAIGDAWTGRYRPPVERAAADAPLAQKSAALRVGVAAVAEDRPIGPEIDTIFNLRDQPAGDQGASPVPSQTAGQTAGNQDARGRPPTRGRRDPDRPQAVFDAARNRYLTRMELVELDSLISSQLPDGGSNPDYPSELQPRDRDRMAMRLQVPQLAASLEPEMLGRSPDASSGAPLIGPDRIVDSGNGRIAALRRVYEQHPDRAEAYRAFLRAEGFDPEGMAAPVLVRRRLEEITPAQRKELVVAAQKSATQDMSAVERARDDADRLSLGLYLGGDVTTTGNAPFVSAFVSRLPSGDQNALADAQGYLSFDGRRRLQSALLWKAYDDFELIGGMIESLEEGNATIGGALNEVAGRWAQMRQAAKDGQIAPVDITVDLLAAIKLINSQRDAKPERPLIDLFRQQDGAITTRTPGTDLWLAKLTVNAGDGTVRLASRTAITRELKVYIDAAMKTDPSPNMFGEAPLDAVTLLRGERLKTGDGPARAASREAASLPSAQPDDRLAASIPPPEPPAADVYPQYRGQPQEAVRHLLWMRRGEVPGALHHPDIGPIDLVWGEAGTGKSDGFGLAKLERFHPEVLDDLQGILAGMTVKSRSLNRIQLENSTHKAAVRLSLNGQSKTWLLTAFEKADPAAGGRRTDSPADGPDMAGSPIDGRAEGSIANTRPDGNAVERRSIDGIDPAAGGKTTNSPADGPDMAGSPIDGRAGDSIADPDPAGNVADNAAGDRAANAEMLAAFRHPDDAALDAELARGTVPDEELAAWADLEADADARAREFEQASFCLLNGAG